MQKFSALDYIKIDIGNQYGYDKKTFPQRIAWVNSIKDLRSKMKDAEKPAQFMVAVWALEDALQGTPTGHLVGLDACASGIAILGILSGCHITSANTGVTGQKRMDMYGECTKAMIAEMQELTADAMMDVERGDVKQSQMTHFYGSVATPRRIFGEETNELMAFYMAQEKVAPGACYMMREFLASWQPYALEHACTMPDGYQSIVPVLQKVDAKIEIDELAHTCLTYRYDANIGSETGLAVAANLTHTVDGFLVRELVRRCNYDREQLMQVSDILFTSRFSAKEGTEIPRMEQMTINHGFLSLRGADFITDETVLEFSLDYRHELYLLIEETLNRPSFPVLTIHDEYKCHPNYVNEMREVYRDLLVELADSCVGQQIIREVRTDPTYQLEKLSTNLGSEILKSEYFLS